MGYFEKLSGGASRPIQAAPEPEAPPASAELVQEAQPVPVPQEAAPAVPSPAEQEPTKPEASPPPVQEDMKEAPADDTAERKAHEAAEARRKEAWDAEQQKKRAATQAQLDELAAMSDEDVIKASTARVGADVEKITRRNMKEQVAEHIQAVCRRDPTFARRTMLPGKSMVKCFKYINQQAMEYVKQEMEDNDIKPEGGGYGCDVPDDLCFEWARDYFDADEEEKEEKFVPRPYIGKSGTKTRGKAGGKPKARKEPAQEGQISFLGEAG